MNPRGTFSASDPCTSSSSSSSSFLRVEIKLKRRRSVEEAERSAGIASVSDLRTIKLNTRYEIGRSIASEVENCLLGYLQHGGVLDGELRGLVN